MMLSSEPQWRISKIKEKTRDIQSKIQSFTAVNTTTEKLGEGTHAMWTDWTALKRADNLLCNATVWRSGNERCSSDTI